MNTEVETGDNLQKDDWDHYWGKAKPRALYDVIAEFYRKFLIRPSLNHFFTKYFSKNSRILHAGCGSGQVDRDIRHHAHITGLDFSPMALKVYERENSQFCKSMLGSVFAIPAEDNSIDGIYNLGVMEHFTENDVNRILQEFRRVLKPGGRVVLFWPPEFGASVMFFKVMGRVLKFVFRREFKFHPDEITRVKSKKHASEIIARNNLKQLEYYFGPRDAFTYSVVVAEKVVN